MYRGASPPCVNAPRALLVPTSEGSSSIPQSLFKARRYKPRKLAPPVTSLNNNQSSGPTVDSLKDFLQGKPKQYIETIFPDSSLAATSPQQTIRSNPISWLEDALLSRDRSSPAASTSSSSSDDDTPQRPPHCRPFAASQNPYRNVTSHSLPVDAALRKERAARAASLAVGENNIVSVSHKFEHTLSSSVNAKQHIFSAGGHSTTTLPPSIIPSPPELYKKIVDIGAGKATTPLWKVFALAALAGSYTAFGATLALTVGGNCPGLAASNPGLQKMVLGLVGLPFGAMMALVCGAELFTANLALTSAALYEGRVSKTQIASSWLASFSGNALGATLLVALVWGSGIFATAAAPLSVAVTKTSLTFTQAFIRGVLCNWLLCLAVWQGNAASCVVGKGVGVMVPIAAFVTMGFEHCVANMFFIPLGMVLGAGVSVQQYLLHNLLPVTLGNLVGGTLCVGAMYYLVYGSVVQPKQA